MSPCGLEVYIPSSEIIVDNNVRQLPSTRFVVAGLAGACCRLLLTRPVIVGQLVSFVGHVGDEVLVLLSSRQNTGSFFL